MQVSEALLAQSVSAGAHALAEAGISVIPLIGKKPVGAWDKAQQRPAPPSAIEYWMRRGWLSNVGIVLGKVSGGLVALDVDARISCEVFENEFPHLADTLTVTTTRGRHYYYYAAEVPATTISSPFELRSNGAYIVAPPSVHPSGQPYRVENAREPLAVSSLSELQKWIRARGGTCVTARPSYPTEAVKDSSRYGAAVLAAESQAVAQAAEGTANNRLNLAAFKCGQLVPSGHLSRGEIERVLMSAAWNLTQRDGEASTIRTINSGLDAGIRNPRRAS